VDIQHIVLPSAALALGVAASVYLFVWWIRHRKEGGKRFVLFWALSLFFFYWFQVPAILVGFGRTITVTDFNFFFALTFPITFLALILIFLGILGATGLRISGRKYALFFAWFGAAIAFFADQFIVGEGIIQTYSLPLVGNIIFYLPIRIMIIILLARWLFRQESKTTFGVLGSVSIIAESVLGLTRNFIVIKNVLAYPPQFWYPAMTSSNFFLITQAVSVILLALGFYFFHRTRNYG